MNNLNPELYFCIWTFSANVLTLNIINCRTLGVKVYFQFILIYFCVISKVIKQFSYVIKRLDVPRGEKGEI